MAFLAPLFAGGGGAAAAGGAAGASGAGAAGAGAAGASGAGAGASGAGGLFGSSPLGQFAGGQLMGGGGQAPQMQSLQFGNAPSMQMQQAPQQDLNGLYNFFSALGSPKQPTEQKAIQERVGGFMPR